MDKVNFSNNVQVGLSVSILALVLCTLGSHLLISHMPSISRTSFMYFYFRLYLPSYFSSLRYDWKGSFGTTVLVSAPCKV